ncbi:MAG TPA: hypothetical protein VLX28_16380 [Thermoanaerobaculia bacterium]|nr:hypothetical protein [Thermoanaerobaculia bacterium]
MTNQVGTGLLATRSVGQDADMTFVWNAEEVYQPTKGIKVTVDYGAGTSTSNEASAIIPYSTTPGSLITISGSSTDSTLKVNGNLQVAWGDYDKAGTPCSYIVTFTGAMLRENVNDVASSNLTGVPTDTSQIIVCARLRPAA